VERHEYQSSDVGRGQDQEYGDGEWREHACQAVHGLMLLVRYSSSP
jgi:hypothetical protein